MGSNHTKALATKQRAEYRRRQTEVCKTKVKYRTGDVEKEGLGRNRELYKCEYCDGFHTTHKKPNQVRRTIAEQKAQDVLDQFR